MTAPTMHFGPEWMRKPARTNSTATAAALEESLGSGGTSLTSNAYSYSALVSPAPAAQVEKGDEVHPFRYSKEDLLRIYRETGGKASLGIEVERWEGVVREVGNEPVGLRDMGEGEKKLFAGPLNSDLRRRQSTDFLSVNTTGAERPRLNHTASGGAASPLRERFAGLGRRRDSSDSPSLTLPRKLSLSGQQPLLSPRDTSLPSPRHRPGFDGVLSSGESWVARRRASEGLLKNGARGENMNGDNHVDTKGTEIKEEDEDEVAAAVSTQPAEQPAEVAPSQQPPPAAVPSPPLDLASVEWSYLDPQQQIQGPFRADIMQKWHDEGYFTPDLLMKRTKLDNDWVAVREMTRRANGAQIFLIAPPAPSPPPPGLGRLNESPVPGFALPASNGPLQPLPTRTLLTSTLESYLGTGTPSDSPTSSYSANRFGSPDLAAFGSRTGLNQYSAPDSPSNFAGPRRNTYHDPALDGSMPRSNSYGSGRSASIDAYGFNNGYTPNQQWNGNTNGGFDSNANNRGSDAAGNYFGTTGTGTASSAALPPVAGFNHLRGPHDSPFNDPGFQQHEYNNNMANSYNYTNGLGGAPYQNGQQQQYSQSPSLGYQQQSYPSPSPMPIQATAHHQQPQQQSPWNTPEPAARRSGPFDAPHPTASNTSVSRPAPAPAPAPGWNREPAPQAPVESSWLLASKGAVDEGWKDATGPNALTADNLGQHNILHEVAAIIPETVPVTPDVQHQEAIAAPVEMAPVVATKRPKVKAAAAVPAKVVMAASPPPAPITVPTSVPRAAWSTEDDVKKTNPSNGLREIQDAELKRSQAARALERERERANRAAAPAQTDDAPFVASWGLPTSQAGAGRSAVAPLKDANGGLTPSASATAAPVWTTAAKSSPVVKKTMKEIQDEEERRKKTAVAKEGTAATAARRAYAEKTGPAPQAGNTAWTTVGSKAPAPALAPARPVLPPSASSSRANGVLPPRAPVSAAVKAAPAVRDEPPAAPSQDFLKWLADTLKGLNTSVNVEEIMSVLLTFPTDPDASTAEIISEVIYANSTTLDGRRFTSEFITKRKADASSRGRGVGASAGKTLSIADVVKSQPKPTQPEWGAFKVVNKKKKGGRA